MTTVTPTTDRRADPAETHELHHALHCAAKAMLGRAVDLRASGLPLSLDRATSWALARVAALGPCRPSDLATDLELDQSTVSRHLATLETQGAVVRRPDPDDARARLVEATPLGLRAVEAIAVERRRRLAEATARWSDTDRRRLSVLLTRLADDLRASARTPQENP